jgi:hypothetical protein
MNDDNKGPKEDELEEKKVIQQKFMAGNIFRAVLFGRKAMMKSYFNSSL